MSIADTDARTAGLLLPVDMFLQQCECWARPKALSHFQILWNGPLCVPCRISSSEAVTDKGCRQST